MASKLAMLGAEYVPAASMRGKSPERLRRDGKWWWERLTKRSLEEPDLNPVLINCGFSYVDVVVDGVIERDDVVKLPTFPCPRDSKPVPRFQTGKQDSKLAHPPWLMTLIGDRSTAYEAGH